MTSRTGRKRGRKSAVSPQRGRHSSDGKQRAEKVCAIAIPHRRLWLYRLFAVTLMPLVLVAILMGGGELFLRSIGYGFDPSPTIRYEIDGEPFIADNLFFSHRFFPPQMAREFNTFRFFEVKKPQTCRIFVLGASAAQGIPDGAYSFSRILEIMLQQAYPEISFEVVNASMTAINSHVVLPIARDLARYQPDIFIVYLGNNEVVGPYGAGTAFAPLQKHLWLLRAGIELRTLRLGQWIAERAAQDAQEVLRGWGGMQMYLDHQVHATDPALQTVYRHYERNLRDICRTGLDAGAAVVLCTMGANLKDCAPFASQHRPNLTEARQEQWEMFYRQAMKADEQGQIDEALEAYEQARMIDNQYADLHFRMALCLEQKGRFIEARTAYLAAMQYDTIRFRADEMINTTIRKVAGQLQPKPIILADVDRMLTENSENNLPGDKWFYEHVHLTFEGNFQVARLLFMQLQPILAQRMNVTVQGREAPALDICAARLAYTDLDRYRIWKDILNNYIRKPPFTNQFNNAVQKIRLQERIDQLKPFSAEPYLAQAVKAYRQALDARPDDWYLHWKLGILLTEELQDYPAAMQEYSRVQELMPHFHRGYLAMGQTLLSDNRPLEALKYLQQATQMRPARPEAHFHLGQAYRVLGKLEEAASCYYAALRCQTDYTPVYNPLGEVLYGCKRYDEAIAVCRQGLEFQPEDAILHCNLGLLLATTGRMEEARKEFKRALQLDPQSERIRAIVGRFIKPIRQETHYR
ncbi:MAG: tetratricopeptide repeat protein [Sedimentisphaerales bacterium]|nr:tetratricopeptide repeat protein [Sedimentisphaerales bacterium]